MASTLGEKLRQAREANGITISEVAEQTRISSLYLEGIEADDYGTLPGGIFNKGFVKSYAKYVGLDEQEALQDYARLMSSQENRADDELRTYRPEVLTDDRNNSSTLLTIVFAIILLGLISWGAYAFAKYYGESTSARPTPTETANNSNTSSGTNRSDGNAAVNPPAPLTGDIKIEVRAVSEVTSLSYAVDGTRLGKNITPDDPLMVEMKENFAFGYSKFQSANVRLTINGKEIGLPEEPEKQSGRTIEILISKDNVDKIFASGQVIFEPQTEDESNANDVSR